MPGNEALKPLANDAITSRSSIDWRPDIDGLRALAVFAVFAFHAFPKLKFLKGGFIGVDIFFVISGFLISSIIFSQLTRGTFSFWVFYSRRIRRIYPALLVVLVGCLGVGWFYLLADEYMQLGKHTAGGAGFVANIVLFFEEGYFNNASTTKPLLHLWSLGIEEQFYIFWPLILWLTWKIKPKAMFWVALAIAVVSFALNLFYFKSRPELDFFLPHTRIWELLCGAMLAWGTLNWKGKAATIQAKLGGDKLSHILSVSGFILLAVSIVFMNEKGFPGWQAVVPVLASVLIIMAGKDAVLNKWVLSNKVLVWFGLISYPFYLWHWPLISMKWLISLRAPTVTYSIAAFVACTLLAWLTTRFIENPLRFGGYARIKTMGLFATMVVMGIVGYTLFAIGGLPQRFPAGIQNIQKLLVKKFNDKNTGFKTPCYSEFRKDADYKKCQRVSEEAAVSNKKTIVIWGDSQAAAFVPGFRKHFGEDFNIVQRTSGACPAVGRDATPACSRVVSMVSNEIKQLQPWAVVLSARWGLKDYQESIHHFKDVIDQLRASGINRVVVLGPVPDWEKSLPKAMIFYSRENGRFPIRFNQLDDRKTYAMDKQISQWSQEVGVPYVSPVKALCNAEGCQTMATEGDVQSILYFDDNHLTTLGSEYLVGQLKGSVEDSLGQRNAD